MRVSDYLVREHGQMAGIKDTSSFEGALPSDGGKEVTPDYLLPFEQNPGSRHGVGTLMRAMFDLQKQTGLGFSHGLTEPGCLAFDAVKEYNRIFEKAAALGPYLFGENPGIPAGGQTQALIDMPMTNFLSAYVNENFIAKQILTPYASRQQTGLIPKLGNEHNNPPSLEEALADGTADISQINTYSTGFDSYVINTYALMGVLTLSEKRNISMPYSPEREINAAIKLMLMLLCEIDMATKLMASALYTDNNHMTMADGSRVDDNVAIVL